tara:strand:- start:2108 stop:2743 length:636 start_codon:yes stop_codon:yes gene_type:complete
MKNLMENWNKYLLKESGLSRVHQHIEAHDCAILTAFRNDPKDMSKCVKGSIDDADQEGNTRALNKRRNRDLKAILFGFDYGVTAVDGSYIENFEQPDQIEVKEDSLFVVNLNDDPDFVRNVQEMAEKFCQDSVIIIPQHGKDAYLYGTNNSEFPGYGEKVEVGNLKMGKESEFMTRVNKRPFTFGEGLETYKNLSRLERMVVKSIKKQLLK